MGRVCPACGRAIPRGTLHRCPNASAPSRDGARERERRGRESWRASYTSRAYESARKAALERSHGLCEACGTPVFGRRGRDGWRRLSRDFGATHHVVPLSRGGSNEASNVVVLCARCHGLAHSTRCAGSRDAGELIARIRGAL